MPPHREVKEYAAISLKESSLKTLFMSWDFLLCNLCEDADYKMLKRITVMSQYPQWLEFFFFVLPYIK